MRIQVADDPFLSDTRLIGQEGFANVPGCGPVHLAGLDLDEIERTIADCLVQNGVYDARPSVAVPAVERSGTVVLLVGENPVTRRRVPFEPGMTLVNAIASGMAESPDRIVLRRKGQSFVIDLRPIFEGREADEPLERDDEIVVEAQLPVRSESERASSLGPPATPAQSGLDGASCGDLLLEMAGLSASGMGAGHPRVLRVGEAIGARCSDETETPSLEKACTHAREELHRAQTTIGEAHPRARTLKAQIDLCPSLDTKRLDCAALRARQTALIDSGKAENHPSRIALDRLVKGCY